jgi:hypothetical protein
MSGNVIEFRNPSRPIAQFIRINESHRRYGDLYAAGKLPIRRAVFDASRITSQKEFVQALKRDHVEIVLDTEVAELAAAMKFQTHVKKAPWASIADDGLLHHAYFDGSYSQANIIKTIAEFAVQNGVDTILAPSHLIADRNFNGWLTIDAKSCLELRKELDRSGGSHIRIDYPIIHSHTAINHADTRNQLIERIADLPIENLWIRASGLGNEPKPQTSKQFLTSLYDLQQLGLPIILDHVDGLMAQAMIAFGGVSGVSQGIGERFSFDAGNWHKTPEPRDESQPFGRTTYIEIPGLGKRINKREFQLLASAKSGHKYLGCQDRCCSHGVRSMLDDTLQHAAYQALAPIRRLSEVPNLNREGFFLDKPLREAEQLARNIKDLNPSKIEAEKSGVNLESLKKRLSEYHSKIGRYSDALSSIHDKREAGSPRAKVCEYRVGLELRDGNREQS